MPLWAALSLGFVFAFAHCLGMCGGIVAAYAATLPEAGQGAWPAHGLYNLGRMVSYSALGALAGGAGTVLAWGGRLAGFQGGLSLVTGAVMIGLGLGGLGWKVLKFDAVFASLGGGALRSLFGKVLSGPVALRTFGVGVLNGLLPCGLVYSAATIAASTGSVGGGAAVMAVFALGTTPAMLLLGLIAFRLGIDLRRRLQVLGAGLLLGLGIMTVWRAFG